MWYLIVRKETPPERVIENGIDIGPGEFPPEGFPIMAFPEKERAELYLKGAGPNYEVIEVIKNERK